MGKNWNFKDWYKKNATGFNAERRNKYHADPEYRARVLEANRKNREKRAQERSVEDRERRAASRVSVGPSFREIAVEVNGQMVTMVTIRALADAVNRSPQSIRLYEKNGLIPKAAVRGPRGARLYTPEQVLEIQQAFAATTPTPKDEYRPVFLRVRTAAGEEIVLGAFRIGILAKAVGRTVLTLEQMERKGTFPETPLRGPSGHRYYTVEMMEATKDAFDALGGLRLRGDSKKIEFHNRVQTAWDELGLMGAEVIGYAEGNHGEEAEG